MSFSHRELTGMLRALVRISGSIICSYLCRCSSRIDTVSWATTFSRPCSHSSPSRCARPDSDCFHPTKCRWPFAAGELSTSAGWFSAIVLIATSAVISLVLPLPFIAALGIYFIVTCLYSFWLKAHRTGGRHGPRGTVHAPRSRRSVRDRRRTVILAPIILNVFLSQPRLSLKRYSELLGVREERSGNLPGRGYSREDDFSMFSLGVA